MVSRRKGETEAEWRKRNREEQQKHYQQIKKRCDAVSRRYREYHREYARTWRKKSRDFLINKLGKKCVICGSECKSSFLVFHEKNLCPHKEHLKLDELKKRWKDFVPLCRFCHVAFHRMLKYKEKFEKLQPKRNIVG